jgi:DNA repair protein RadC
MRKLQELNLFNENRATEIQIIYKSINKDKIKVTSSRDVYETLKPFFNDTMEHHENFYILLLNRTNKVLGVNKISEGGISGTVVDPKLVFQAALVSHASSIILAHNHPSGNTEPSDADIELTKKLSEAGKFMDLPILDHLILADEIYLSFKDEGKL